jgi:hypothetical protein
MPTPSEIQATRDALWAQIQASISSGRWQVKTYNFADQAVELWSLEDAWSLLAKLDGMLAAASSGGMTKYVQTSKGV